MQILLVSDLHYTLKQFDWVGRVAPDFDLVVLAGDQLDAGSFVEYDAQIAAVETFLTRLAGRARLVVSSGNHDLDTTGPDGERVAAWLGALREAGATVDGDSLAVDGTLVTVCPWWDGPLARDAVGAQLARDAAIEKERWIWVYHAPPDGSPTSWTGARHYGDADLVAWIDEHRPDLVLTGHVHESPFRSDGGWCDRIGPTWVLNAGRQRGPLPTHVIVDLDAATATWHSLAGVETADLTAGTAPARTAV